MYPLNQFDKLVMMFTLLSQQGTLFCNPNYMVGKNMFSEKVFVVVAYHSVVSNSFVTPWTAAHRLICPWDFPGKNTWSGLPFPTSGHLLDPGLEPASLVSPALAGGATGNIPEKVGKEDFSSEQLNIGERKEMEGFVTILSPIKI